MRCSNLFKTLTKRFVTYVFLSPLTLTKILEFIIRPGELKNECVLNKTLIIITNVYTIRSKLIKIAGRS